MSLTNREKSAPNREKIGTKNPPFFSPLVFHRFRLLDATWHKRKRKLRCSFRNAALQKLHCNIGFSVVRIEKAALQESAAFLPLSCGFQAPTFRHLRLGLAETFPRTLRSLCGIAWSILRNRDCCAMVIAIANRENRAIS